MTAEAVPTPLVMAQQVHRALADGSRWLEVPKGRHLRAQRSARDRDCCVATIYAHTDGEPPARCQRVIRPGLFYVVYQPIHPTTGAAGAKWRYCAPCAVSEWPGVYEVDE